MMTDDLSRTLEEAIERGLVPGLVAMVADRDGIIFQQAAGRISPDANAPMPLDAVFWLASLTKLVTSIAALQLVEQGRLTLDEPLVPLLPKLGEVEVLDGFARSGEPRLRAPRRKITLRHLLTHGAGFAYDSMCPDLLRARGTAGPPPYMTLASLGGPLLFDPGEGWEYGVSTDWVGLAVEAASGETLEDYFAHAIFALLGMADTKFDPSSAMRERLVPVHVPAPSGGFAVTPSPVGKQFDWEFYSGGAGLHGTAGDYMRVLRAILGGGKFGDVRILAPASVAELSRSQLGPVRAGRLGTAYPELYRPFDLLPDVATGWGLATLINPTDIPNRRRAGSLGWSGAANSHYWIDPSEGIAGLLMMQVFPFADPPLLDLFTRYETEVYKVIASRRASRVCPMSRTSAASRPFT